MKSLVYRFAAVGLLAVVGGCAVVPMGPRVAVEPGVVYVAPGYAAPGIGYRWEYHAVYGWGWHHPELGWYRR